MNIQQEEDYIDLGVLLIDFWKGIKRFWYIVILFIFLGVGTMWGYRYFTYDPLYQASASFTVKTTGDMLDNEVNTVYGFFYDKSTADQIEKTFPYILSSGILQKHLCEELGTTYVNGTVNAYVITDSNLVTLSASSHSKEDAKKILDAVIVVYPEVAEYVLGDIEFEFLNEPELQEEPVNRPSVKKDIMIGVLAGTALSMGIILVYALLRKTIRNEEDLKKTLNTALLGMLPEVKEKKILITEKWKKKSRYQEDVYSLQNRVDYLLKKEGHKALLVTSTEPSEGKTTVAINLALAMAQRGEKVLLIDGDLRKPDIKKYLSVPHGDKNMADVLKGNAKLEDAAVYLQEEGLYVLGCEVIVRNAITVINSRRMEHLIKQARDFADVVVIDAPPAGILADAAHYYDYVDGVLMVIRQDWANQSRILDAVLDFPGQGEKLIGCTMNRVKTGFASYGYGYSSYGYGYRYGKYNQYKGKQLV